MSRGLLTTRKKESKMKYILRALGKEGFRTPSTVLHPPHTHTHQPPRLALSPSLVDEPEDVGLQQAQAVLVQLTVGMARIKSRVEVGRARHVQCTISSSQLRKHLQARTTRQHDLFTQHSAALGNRRRGGLWVGGGLRTGVG